MGSLVARSRERAHEMEEQIVSGVKEGQRNSISIVLAVKEGVRVDDV